jgi:hypothetical protein
MNKQKVFSLPRGWGYVSLASLIFISTWAWSVKIENSLGISGFSTGWVLFFVIALLSLFGARKRLSFLPLGPASRWLKIHVAGGFMAVFMFWLHTDEVWPSSFYGQLLTVLFYAISISGIVGLLMETFFPSQLTHTKIEVIFERIPKELAGIRNEVENLVEECTKENSSSVLAEHYLETLRWYFQRPRFFMSNVCGSKKPQHWVHQQCMLLERFLNEKERKYLDKVYALAEQKRKIDFHYALQKMLKTWLLIHIPLAGAVMMMVFWHLIVIQVFFV